MALNTKSFILTLMSVNPVLKKIISPFRVIIDVLIAVLIPPIACVLYAFKRIGPVRLPLSRDTFRALGVFPIVDHYYEPLFNPRHLTNDLAAERPLPGLCLNEAQQVNLLRNLGFADELVEARISQLPSRVEDFYIHNGGFESPDAEFLYQIIRYSRPKKFYEIGSGNSTKIARKALLRNSQHYGIQADHVCIEPYEMPWLEKFGVRVIRERVERCSVSLFQQLEAGDILFIDSSHMIRPQGDVLFEYLQVLPKLRAGVIVHIHDVFTPRDYPKFMICDDNRFWNEQYLMEALLTDSRKFEVMAALNYLKYHHFELLRSVCPFLTQGKEPGSFYIRAL